MLCTAWVSSSLFANGRTAGRKAGAAVTADVLSGAADAGEELEPPRSSAGRTFLLPRSDVIVCTLPRVSLIEGHFLFLGPTAQIGRFSARSATQLCNHAGLGLGRHAMNLKELHLGPRPRAAALASARDLIVSSCGKRPRGRRENHETKNTTHTNTTAYQCPKKPQKWYLPPKYREIGNTGRRWTHRHRAPATGAGAFHIFYKESTLQASRRRSARTTSDGSRRGPDQIFPGTPAATRPRARRSHWATMLRRKRACTCAIQTVIHVL